MIKPGNHRWSRAALTLVTAAMLVGAGLVPAGALAHSQRRSARRAPTSQRPSLYDRSYRQGYDEGYVQGQRDWRSGAPRNPQRGVSNQQRRPSNEHGRNSSAAAAPGYPLGFDLGYSDGYFGRARNPAIPANAPHLSRSATAGDLDSGSDSQAVTDAWRRWPDNTRSNHYPPLRVPDNTVMRLRLTSPINTKIKQAGDRFTAAITSPANYRGATVEGHIAALNRSGQVTGKTELVLAFDSITLADGEQGPFNADLERILLSEQIKKVDEEGRIESGSRPRGSGARSGGGDAVGAVIGGSVGGGKGAVLGMIPGGAAGGGTVYLEGNNDLLLDNGTEMVIRTPGQRQP